MSLFVVRFIAASGRSVLSLTDGSSACEYSASARSKSPRRIASLPSSLSLTSGCFGSRRWGGSVGLAGSYAVTVWHPASSAMSSSSSSSGSTPRAHAGAFPSWIATWISCAVSRLASSMTASTDMGGGGGSSGESSGPPVSPVLSGVCTGSEIGAATLGGRVTPRALALTTLARLASSALAAFRRASSSGPPPVFAHRAFSRSCTLVVMSNVPSVFPAGVVAREGRTRATRLSRLLGLPMRLRCSRVKDAISRSSNCLPIEVPKNVPNRYFRSNRNGPITGLDEKPTPRKSGANWIKCPSGRSI